MVHVDGVVAVTALFFFFNQESADELLESAFIVLVVFLIFVAHKFIELGLECEQDRLEAAEICHDWNRLILLHLAAVHRHEDLATLALVLPDARQNRQKGPFKIASDHICDDGLSCVLLAARIISILSHLVEFFQDAQDNATLLEERQEDEPKRFLDKSHK